MDPSFVVRMMEIPQGVSLKSEPNKSHHQAPARGQNREPDSMVGLLPGPGETVYNPIGELSYTSNDDHADASGFSTGSKDS